MKTRCKAEPARSWAWIHGWIVFAWALIGLRCVCSPHGLLVQRPVWYILSRDVEKGEPRTFRMDRISRPRIVQAMVFQPDVHVVRAQVPQGREWRALVGSM